MTGKGMDFKKDYIVNSHKRCKQYKVEQDWIYSKPGYFIMVARKGVIEHG